MIGERFGRWTVISEAGRTAASKRLWYCHCDCGVEEEVVGGNLRSGGSTSCGCLKAEKAASRARQRSTKHGEAARSGHSPEYRAWAAMHRRVRYPSTRDYHRYGGRGITVCERWGVFENFLADMGRKPTAQHSLDRWPNPDGNYEPGNCRWATALEQRHNRSAA